jgi:uncharacterized hydrophobic protein (TIGR00271 family)
MRYVQLLVPASDLDEVCTVLSDEDVDYVVTPAAERHGDRSLVSFPLPTQAVEYLLDELSAATDEERFTVVLNAETARTDNFESLEGRFVEGTEEDESVAHAEIRSKSLDLQPSWVTYYTMTLLSAVVASAGLLLDSAALVVGSMVIAPQVGSALLASVGTTLGDRGMVTDGLRSQAVGLVLAVLGAAAFGAALRSTAFVPASLDVTTIQQLSQRTSPGLLSLAVGVAAGAAGAIGLATALPVSLVGVMIAAALIPAAAAVGIGLAWNVPTVAYGALVMLVINAASIHVAGATTLWLLDYRPAEWVRGRGLPNLRSGAATVPAATLLVLLAVLAVAGLPLAGQMAFETSANAGVEEVLDDETYEDLELLEVRTSFTTPTGDQPRDVTVVLSRPADRTYPSLADRLARRVAARTGADVSVTVTFSDRQRARA